MFDGTEHAGGQGNSVDRGMEVTAGMPPMRVLPLGADTAKGSSATVAKENRGWVTSTVSVLMGILYPKPGSG